MRCDKDEKDELIVGWKEAPAKPSADNPHRSGAAIGRNGHILGNAPAGESCDEAKKRTVLDYYDFRKIVPFFDGKPKLVGRMMKWLKMDDVNYLHHRNLDTPGAAFVRGLLDDLRIAERIDNASVLDRLPEGAFITVSNHPFGALDGVMLIDIMASRRADYKVMVNMILNAIRGMRPNFIAVDPMASDDPKKRLATMKGIKEAMAHVKSGHPLGFFPAGAVSKLNWRLRIEDRRWQPSIIRLIKQLNVPVVPVYFHGHNSLWFNILGVISWKLRTLRLPGEVFAHHDTIYHISIGDIISPEEQMKYDSLEEFGEMLRSRTYALRRRK